MMVHLFGATSSPSVCGFALLQTVVDGEGTISPEVAQAIQKNFYVDDLLISFSSINEAVRVTGDVQSILDVSGFHLTKFVSNCERVLIDIPEGDRGKSLEVSDSGPLEMKKALGIIWNLLLRIFG